MIMDSQLIVYFPLIGNRYSIFFETSIMNWWPFQSIIDPWIIIDYLIPSIGKNYRFYRLVKPGFKWPPKFVRAHVKKKPVWNPTFFRVICKEKEKNRKNFAGSCGTVLRYLRENSGIILGQLQESWGKVARKLQDSCNTIARKLRDSCKKVVGAIIDFVLYSKNKTSL